MIQKTLFPFEKKIIQEFNEMEIIVCDISIANKIKKLNEVENEKRV